MLKKNNHLYESIGFLTSDEEFISDFFTVINNSEYYSYDTRPMTNNKICPKCNIGLIIRTGRFGKFLGCPNYPNCKYTESIKENK